MADKQIMADTTANVSRIDVLEMASVNLNTIFGVTRSRNSRRIDPRDTVGSLQLVFGMGPWLLLQNETVQ